MYLQAKIGWLITKHKIFGKFPLKSGHTCSVTRFCKTAAS